MKKFAIALALALAFGGNVWARHYGRPPVVHHYHHSHHHHSRGWDVAAGVIGAGIIGATLYDAVRPKTVVVQQPAPVVVQQPVIVQQPAPVIVQQPAPVVVHQPAPVYQTQNVWVEGQYVDQVQANGTVVRVWQPGHYEQRQVQVR